jgi:NADPH:quinone reductase-like Zn-dependent oxidoreductase
MKAAVRHEYGSPDVLKKGGLFKPKFKILGADVAGRVEAVGIETALSERAFSQRVGSDPREPLVR